MITVYGIPNCDVVKKATKWLQDRQIAFHFHDYRKDGITPDTLQQWCRQMGWEKILNTRSTAWRSLDEGVKNTAANEAGAILLMTQNPTLIKRPAFEKDGNLLAVGFDEAAFSTAIGW